MGLLYEQSQVRWGSLKQGPVQKGFKPITGTCQPRDAQRRNMNGATVSRGHVLYYGEQEYASCSEHGGTCAVACYLSYRRKRLL